ncbi:SMP-30/gluconolactonase/LRE family protein [Phenylobacterium sp. J367]|uniref:SMP-30/gluconolactonase/LRE family protein n=1 Tax=Phenylobacterium sp. J367 TaxID=2898435 RepID=UPI002150D9FF|nr:SMP-30/gluconolactonase/LRE family protein [Phenylobacterium sp. J367]MCR5878632.1 SMP-30/gluconolactonase/LRE family protein [Phenylobacterium sp. J367]
MSATTEPESVYAADAELGEGPVWMARDDAVWFVDIKGLRIHKYEVTTGAAWSWAAPAQPGFIAPLADSRWIAGLKTGLHYFDPKSGRFDLLATVEDPKLDNRLNDGFVDQKGRLWFGSMHDGETNLTGALYRLDGRTPVRQDPGYCITNGPAMSPDGRTLYHTDTLKRVIYAFDVDANGKLTGKRTFAEIDEGYPDGPAVDAEGCVWTALFAGRHVRRYSPKGELLEKVAFPVANITKLAFAGDDLKTVYATTAWKGLSKAEREDQPQAGALFRFEVDVPGLPQNQVRDV